jgi:hypothetical protein
MDQSMYISISKRRGQCLQAFCSHPDSTKASLHSLRSQKKDYEAPNVCRRGRVSSMPMTYAEHEKKLKAPAVCELLPLRDLPAGDNVMVRTNGAFVAGYQLRGILAYFATDGDRNQTKSMLEALFRSVPDVSMRLQFRYEISEHLGDLLDSYVQQQRSEQSEVMALDAHRLRMWMEKEHNGFYFENRLHIYLVWDPRIHAKLYHSAQQNRKLGGFTVSQKKAIQRTRKEHETYLAEFESILRGVEGSMEATNLGPRRLSTQELFEELKYSQHPSRRDRRPYVPGEEMFEYRSAREQATQPASSMRLRAISTSTDTSIPS